MNVCMDTTSMPRWDEERSIAGGGRTFTILSFGDEAAEQARNLLLSFDGRRVDWMRLPAEWGDTAARVLRRQLDASRVGCRLVLVGSEAAVLAARAVAVAGGLVDEEIMPVPIDTADHAVYCAHCHTTHLADVEVGRCTTCPNCRAELVVYHHVSRHHAAYLGYMIDAEER
ncbi:dimethylamine monooxygenase subunit DmmA family protein [Rhodococcus sp. DMU2021]|uniref:dimethylamine monooxygenase subunit DmmA family protein n=1 Tax=Rhodococcus sp. DMU2021 TaxID=2866997 RepID=UPI0027E3624C|nr:dimethylamine monooxygenase subunit DmmA family protein [Rhodococcus sp. DMU2021]